jgi:cobalamin synthase
MSRWRRLLLVTLPLALVLTAAFRFIQQTDAEYSFWVHAYGETATLLEARCAALASPAVCTRAKERRSLASEFRSYRDQVLAWWWPTLVSMLLAWAAASASLMAIAVQSYHRRGTGRLAGKTGCRARSD